MTLACEYANYKLLEVINNHNVDDSLVQMLMTV